TTDYYAPEHERCLAWDDPAVGIDWPISQRPVISTKDDLGLRLETAETFD
ncbi:dTDP-4-keto-6-deoxy-D-glucose epimerase, partial [Acinetobacter baumannii]|nr:dTDP-4-keto-6-deoxy-D-glucose epimerase [Acinetobacter baumannii]